MRSILLQQYPACLARLTWMVCKMGGMWSTNTVLLGVVFRVCSKQHATFLFSSHLAFSQSISLNLGGATIQ